MLDQPPFPKKPAPGATDQQVVQGGGEDIDQIQEVGATGDEQAIYDKYMPEAYRIMGDEKAFPDLVKMIDQDPVVAIADATVAIVEQVEAKLGVVEDTDILQAMAEEIVPALAELAEERGADVPDAELEKAVAQAIGDWSRAHPDRVDAAGMQGYSDMSKDVMGQGAQEQSAGGPAVQAQAQPPQGMPPQEQMAGGTA